MPNPTEQDLVDMSRKLGEAHNFGDCIESAYGSCDFGKFGTAVFRSEEDPRIQIWHLSNGRDFITITHICPEEPDPQEVEDAAEIVRGATIVH